MKQIKLSQGKFALVDDEDFEWLNQFKWFAHYELRPNAFYANRNVPKEHKGEPVRMARLIMNTPKGMVCDHINGDTLDNRKSNLRNCSVAQNNMNRNGVGGTYSGYKGVFPAGTSGWFSRIGYQGKKIYLGFFLDPTEAAKFYDKKAIELHGEYARLNFPLEAE